MNERTEVNWAVSDTVQPRTPGRAESGKPLADWRDDALADRVLHRARGGEFSPPTAAFQSAI